MGRACLIFPEVSPGGEGLPSTPTQPPGVQAVGQGPSLIPRAQGLAQTDPVMPLRVFLESEVTDFAGIFCLVGHKQW